MHRDRGRLLRARRASDVRTRHPFPSARRRAALSAATLDPLDKIMDWERARRVARRRARARRLHQRRVRPAASRPRRRIARRAASWRRARRRREQRRVGTRLKGPNGRCAARRALLRARRAGDGGRRRRLRGGYAARADRTSAAGRAREGRRLHGGVDRRRAAKCARGAATSSSFRSRPAIPRPQPSSDFVATDIVIPLVRRAATTSCAP